MPEDNTQAPQRPSIGALRTPGRHAENTRPTPVELRLSVPYTGENIVEDINHARSLVETVRKVVPGVQAELHINGTAHPL
jgi:hypothetical protein